MLGSLLILIPRIGLKKITIMIVLVATIFMIDTQLKNSKEGGLNFFFKDLSQTGGSIWSKDSFGSTSSRDLNRKVWLLSAYPALTENVLNFIFGYGFRTSGYVIAPHVYDIFKYYGKEVPIGETVGSEAITNIAVDTGILGIVLLCSLFIFSGWTVYIQNGKFRWIFVFSIIITFAWLFVTNIVDIVIFYYILMPSGIYSQLARLSMSRTNRQII